MTSDITVALLADLRDVTNDLLAGGYTRTTIALLQRNLRRGVRSAVGARLVVERDALAVPLRLDLVTRRVDPIEIRAAVRVLLADVVPGVCGWVDLYAADQGAFDQLALDLGRELSVGDPGPDRGPPRRVVVTEPPSLPSRPLLPELAGLVDFSRVNHALGILLNRGYSLPAAREVLEARARQTGTDVGTVAADIIDRF